MAVRCICTGATSLPGSESSKGSDVNRREKTSLRDKQGIASLVGKSEAYSIKTSPRIHLNRFQDATPDPVPEAIPNPGRYEPLKSIRVIVQNKPETKIPVPMVASFEPAKFIFEKKGPFFHINRQALQIDAHQSHLPLVEFKPQIFDEQSKSAPVKQSTIITTRKQLSTNCESSSVSHFPLSKEGYLKSSEAQRHSSEVLKEMSERSTPVGTPRAIRLTSRLQQSIVSANNGEVSVLEMIPQEAFETLGRLYPKFTISNQDEPSEDSMLSGFSEVVERNSPTLHSQIFVVKKRSEF